MLCLAAGFIGNKVLFERLSLYPGTMLKCSKVDIMAGIDFEWFEINNNRSSVYEATLCSDPPLSIPSYSFAVRSEIARGSVESANNSGDGGRHCLVERPRGK